MPTKTTKPKLSRRKPAPTRTEIWKFRSPRGKRLLTMRVTRGRGSMATVVITSQTPDFTRNSHAGLSFTAPNGVRISSVARPESLLSTLGPVFYLRGDQSKYDLDKVLVPLDRLATLRVALKQWARAYNEWAPKKAEPAPTEPTASSGDNLAVEGSKTYGEPPSRKIREDVRHIKQLVGVDMAEMETRLLVSMMDRGDISALKDAPRLVLFRDKAGRRVLMLQAEQVGEAIRLQILHQDKRFTGSEGGERMPQFRASNGILIESFDTPEWRGHQSRLFLRGARVLDDHATLLVSKADYARIMEALTEWAERAPQFNKPMEPVSDPAPTVALVPRERITVTVEYPVGLTSDGLDRALARLTSVLIPGVRISSTVETVKE